MTTQIAMEVARPMAKYELFIHKIFERAKEMIDA